jgi:hypothetical protein
MQLVLFLLKTESSVHFNFFAQCRESLLPFNLESFYYPVSHIKTKKFKYGIENVILSAVSCEYVNETSHSVKDGEFLD